MTMSFECIESNCYIYTYLNVIRNLAEQNKCRTHYRLQIHYTTTQQGCLKFDIDLQHEVLTVKFIAICWLKTLNLFI